MGGHAVHRDLLALQHSRQSRSHPRISHQITHVEVHAVDRAVVALQAHAQVAVRRLRRLARRPEVGRVAALREVALAQRRVDDRGGLQG